MKIQTNVLANAILIKHLAFGKMSCRELAKETGLDYGTVLRIIWHLNYVGAVEKVGLRGLPHDNGRVFKLKVRSNETQTFAN